MTAIEFKNVYFRYGEGTATILRDVNFSLEYGQMVLLTGSSGCGKSTIMSLLNGTIPNYTRGQFSGDIEINGKSTRGKSISQLSEIVGSVLQNADSQIVHDLVKDEIAFGPENMGTAPGNITEAVNKFTDMLLLDRDARTRRLSGGQKQRLITASTLAMGQKIVLLDEPLANLDTEGAEIILSALKTLSREAGYLVIIAEHRIDRILDYIDKILVLSGAAVSEVSRSELEAQRDQVIPYRGNNAGSGVVLSAENIGIGFGEKTVLKDLSIEIREGEKVLIMGENGCGKTTLTRILARIIKPGEGRVLSPMGSKGNKKWFKNVGYVYQNPDYQLFMPTAEREIDFACACPELKDYVIEKLELAPLLGRHPFSLSEGQKRKLTVASIVCMRPKLLFLDEPTVGQDSRSLENLVDVLLHLNKNYGTALVSVTHDMRCAAALGDRKIRIEKVRG